MFDVEDERFCDPSKQEGVTLTPSHLGRCRGGDRVAPSWSHRHFSNVNESATDLQLKSKSPNAWP